MSYCANCRAQLEEEQKFCAGCGTAVGEAKPAAQTSADTSPTDGTPMQQSSEATLQKLAVLKAQAHPVKSPGNKILLGVVLVFLVGAVAAIAGVIYGGYRVKPKASAALDNLESKSGANKVTSEVGSGGRNKSNPDKGDGG